MSSMEDDDEVLLLDNQKIKKRSNFHIFKNGIVVIVSTLLVVAAIFVVANLVSDKYASIICSYDNIKLDKINITEIESPNENVNINTNENVNINTSENVNENTNENENENEDTINDLPYGFELVDENNKDGPITVNREKDDGTKLNIRDYIHPEDPSFYYDEEKFKKLNETVKDDSSEYLCEYGTGSAPEAYEGYEIVCPAHYTIKIDKVFYGRHAGDKKHCDTYYEGRPVEDSYLTVEKECGNEPIANVREICEGQMSCTLRPGGSHFTDSCPSKFKYLHVNYHCVKDKELKKEKIAIVMFSNIIKPNSIYENAISSFYQYAKIHGYDFEYNHYRYDTERQIFFMKLNSVLEKIIIGLKEKKYDWIFWVDSDVILANPNIRLEAFLPNEKMSNIHFIGADDVNGFNAGVFLIRVHSWSLNFLMRAMSYSYFNKQKGLRYADQSSLNNVLTESKQDDTHYIVVPQNWFNSYIGLNKDGDFLLHLAGHVNKDDEAKTFRDHIRNDEKWYGKTSKEMRKEVLKYYALPKEEQHSIKFEKRQLKQEL